MKVNITGKGLIPGINQLAPVYNQELEKPVVRRILNYSNLRVYGANGIGLITKRNIDAVFDTDIKPTPVLEKPTEIPVTKTEEPVTEVPEVAAQEIQQYQGGKPTPEETEPVVEETADETSSEDVTDATADADVVTEEATSDESPVADTQHHYNGNKKNKKKNHYNNNKG